MPISAPKIPEGLPELMRGLAKSVIKENPENLYVHAAEYFENLIRERDGELDRGYQGFNAYQVYADYKEQTREKLGLAPTKQPSASDGEDAGDTGSGDSGSKSRGRRRRRTRNQPSTEKDSSVPVTGGPDNGGSDVLKQKSLSEDSVEPVSVVEDEVMKVHYNPPEAAPPGRVVSAQSVEAEQAVLTVLEDDQILDSDGKDTAEEDDPVERAEDDDIGTAPSTAEITEEAAPAVLEPSIENEEIPLQDLETCFMHANVDRLLEKHSGDIAEGVEGDLKKGDTKATENAVKQDPVPAVDENVKGEPVLESANLVEKPDHSNTDPAPVPSEADEPTEKPTEVQFVGQDVPEGKIAKAQDIGETTKLDEDQGKEAEKAPEKPNSRSGSAEAAVKPIASDHSTDDALAKKLEPETPANEASPEAGNEQSVPENAALSVGGDANKPEEDAKAIETVGLTNTANGADAKEPIKLTSRMGMDDDEPVGDRALNDQSIDEVDTGNGDKDANSITDSIVDRENDQVATDTDKGETVHSITTNTEQTVEPSPLGPMNRSEDVKKSLSRNGSTENEVDPKQDPATDKPEPEKAPVEQYKPEDVPVTDGGHNQDNEEIRGSELVISPKHEPASTASSGVSRQTSKEVTEPTNIEEPNRVAPIDVGLEPDVGVSEQDDAKKNERTRNDDAQNITAAEPFGDAITDVPVVEEVVAKKSQSPVGGEMNKTSVDSDKSDTVQSEATKEATVEQSTVDEPAVPETSPPNNGGNDEGNKLEATKTDSGEESSDTILGQSTEQETNRAEAAETSSTMKDAPIEGPVLYEAATKEDRESPTKTGDKMPLPESSTNQIISVASRSQLEPLPKEEDKQTIQQSAEGNEAENTPIDGGAVEIAEDGAKDVESTLDKSAEATNNIEPEENGNILVPEPTEDPIPASDKQSSIEKSIGTEPQIKSDGTNVNDASEGSTTVERAPSKARDPGTEKTSKQLDVPEGAQNAVNPMDQPEPAVPEADIAKDRKEDPKDEGPRPGSAKPSSPEHSLEEVVEEPCIKREVSPSKTLPPAEKEESIDSSKDQELEEIKKVDLSQLSKDSAEALFYSLKKSALENQDPEGLLADDHPSAESEEAPKSRDSNGGGDDDDDKDVVVTEEPPAATAPEDTAKRTFTDDFLDESPLPDDARRAEAPSEAPVNIPEATAPEEKRSCGSAEAEDDLTPMQTASMRLKQFQDAMHGRADTTEGDTDAASAKRPVMRRCMTEMAELQRYVSADDSADPSYVEEEDQFDGYYIGHIKNKILASSVSVADSDCFDPTRGSSVESVDENNVRTALETIASTDTESTIASQATIQQATAGKRSYLQKHSQNTSSNIPYASFGNAAIDKSLDEFIEREERNKQDEAFAEAATKIQRSYRTHKKRLLRSYHSTMRTCTEDASAESGGEEPSNVIQIKLDQKRATDLGPAMSDGGEESPDPTDASSLHVPLGRRPMQSLNIDEYDTVTRRQMLTRGVAMQRNSTPDDDSGKSTNASTDRRSSLSGGGPVASDSPPEGEGQPSAEPTVATTSGSSEEHDGDQKSPGSKPPGDDREPAALKGALARSSTINSTGQRVPMDVQSLLLVARQRTMPVQIDSSVIRVLPKHMRKRISSADLPNGGKRK